MNTILWTHIADHLSQALGTSFVARAPRALGGGCINATYLLESATEGFFVKLNAAHSLDMFVAEAQGLAEIAASKTLRTPTPICYGAANGQAYLVLEYIAMDAGQPAAQQVFGRQLAAMHRVTRDAHGWTRDNTIGAIPQHNTPNADWLKFWGEQRLGFQLRLAAENGHGGRLQKLGERLQAQLPALFAGHAPRASLLHGDLWSGNYGFDTQGAPLVFDPAVYFGDRETDLAMTELFGGFSSHFYRAYEEAYPLPEGYALRKTLYNLYHVLNHLNLFGGSYLAQAEQMIVRLLHETG
ncbi:MAG: fructosamine kinase family protein [Gammaproteobacteria bacterium]